MGTVKTAKEYQKKMIRQNVELAERVGHLERGLKNLDSYVSLKVDDDELRERLKKIIKHVIGGQGGFFPSV